MAARSRQVPIPAVALGLEERMRLSARHEVRAFVGRKGLDPDVETALARHEARVLAAFRGAAERAERLAQDGASPEELAHLAGLLVWIAAEDRRGVARAVPSLVGWLRELLGRARLTGEDLSPRWVRDSFLRRGLTAPGPMPDDASIDAIEGASDEDVVRKTLRALGLPASRIRSLFRAYDKGEKRRLLGVPKRAPRRARPAKK